MICLAYVYMIILLIFLRSDGSLNDVHYLCFSTGLGPWFRSEWFPYILAKPSIIPVWFSIIMTSSFFILWKSDAPVHLTSNVSVRNIASPHSAIIIEMKKTRLNFIPEQHCNGRFFNWNPNFKFNCHGYSPWKVCPDGEYISDEN
jgi:hypothetical protein